MLLLFIPGEQLIATILQRDAKTTSYELAMMRAIGDLMLSVPDAAPRT